MKKSKSKRPMSSFAGKTRPLSGISFQSGIGFSNALKNHTTFVERTEKSIKKTQKHKNNHLSSNLLQINNFSTNDLNKNALNSQPQTQKQLQQVQQQKQQKQQQLLNQQRLLMTQAENYRIALPIGKQENISKKFWDQSNQQLQNNYTHNIKSAYKQDNYQFLGKLGTKNTTIQEFTFSQTENANQTPKINQVNQRIDDPEQYKKEAIKQTINVDTLNSFNKLDIDRSIKQQVSGQNKVISRPMTVKVQCMTQGDRAITAQLRGNIQSGKSNVTSQKALGSKNNHRPLTAVNRRPTTALNKSQKVQQQQVVQSGKQSRTNIPTTTHNNHNQNQQIINNFIDLDVKEDLDESGDDVYNQIDNAKNLKKRPTFQSRQTKKFQRIESGLLSKRPISGRQMTDTSQFFTNFNKIIAFTQKELPFEDLFDRNERTLAATFVQFGDLGYYSPVQRIGTYYQFITKMKIVHLLEIIDLQKTITTVEKNRYEIPILLGIIDENSESGQEKKIKTTTLFTQEDQQRIPVGLTLFPEFLEDEEQEELSQTELAQKLFKRMQLEMKGNYDPEYLCKGNYITIEEGDWPKAIKNKVQQSLERYNQYINQDIIRSQDISTFNKAWLLKSLELVDQRLLRDYDSQSRIVIREIIENYKKSMKESILNYILLSPLERTRLHIELLPKQVLSSSQRICREGGFNIQLYPMWHNTYQKAQHYLLDNLHLANLIISQLQNWYVDFSHFQLAEVDTFLAMSKMRYTITFPNFIKIQTNYIKKTVQVFRNVWLRGAILIIKKFKMLKTKKEVNKVFTFNGYQKHREDLEYELKNFMTQFQFISFQNQLEAETSEDCGKDLEYQVFHNIFEKRQLQAELEQEFQNMEHLELNDLQDIRDNAAFRFSLKKEGMFDQFQQILNEDGWSQINKQNKYHIMNTAEVLMGLQLQSIIEKSYQQFEEFIFSYKKMSDHVDAYSEKELDPQKLEQHFMIVNKTIKMTTTCHISQQQDIRQIMSSNTELEQEKMDFQNEEKYQCYPFLKVNIQIDEHNQLCFQENQDYIVSKLTGLLLNITQAFDNLNHPRHWKIVVNNKNERKPSILKTKYQIEQEQAFNYFLDKNHNDQYLEFIKKVKLKEKKPKQKNLVQSFLETNKNYDENLEIKHIKVISQNAKRYSQAEEAMVQHVLKHYQECHMSFKLFDQFQPFIQKTLQKQIQETLDNPKIQQQEYKQLIDMILRYRRLLESIADSIYFPMFEVNNKGVKEQFRGILEEQQWKILNHLEDSVTSQISQLNVTYIQINYQIKQTITTAQQNQDMENYKDDLVNKKVQLVSQSKEVFRKMLFLVKLDRPRQQQQQQQQQIQQNIINNNVNNTNNITLNNMSNNMQQQESNNLWRQDMFNAAQQLFDQPQTLEKELKNSEEKHQVEHSKLQNELKKEKDQFQIKLESFTEDINVVEGFTDYNKYKLYVEKLQKLEEQLQSLNQKMKYLQDQEEKLQGFVFNNSYEAFFKIEKMLRPNQQLWTLIHDYVEFKKEWQNKPIKQINPAEIENVTREANKKSIELQKQIDKQSLVYNVTCQFRQDTSDVLIQNHQIEILSNKGIKKRHGEEINDLLKDEDQEIDFDKNSYKEILMTDFHLYLDEIEKISEQASKEYKLELMLEGMQKEWKSQIWRLGMYKQTNILQGQCVDDIQQILDDHIYKAQTIRQNPNVLFMEQQAINWEQLMLYIDEVFEVFVQVQQQYLHLEPIFSFGEISASLGSESIKFQRVKETFNNIIIQCQTHPKIIDIMNIPNMNKQLHQCLKTIEEIEKELEKFLEVKRFEFPRFFFLSNEDLLTILAETKDPFLVQPHIKKCFEGIKLLEFDCNKQIIGMISSEEENIQFLQKVSTKESKSSVEKWLGKVERQMRGALEKLAEDSFHCLMNNCNQEGFFNEWVRKYPGQIIQTVNQMYWTAATEDAIKNNKLSCFYEEQQTQLSDIVSLVRSVLTPLESITIGALIVQMVHNTDIVQSLSHKQINVLTDFNWESQMRFYSQEQCQFSVFKIVVKVMTAQEYYGFEYLGNQSRLVFTTLTDRCYRTLMCALQLNLGGAPEGPAGTGKTETVKDLAKTLANQCMVFNCSEGLQTHNMAKFFKGLACTGSWSCYDEFNRIDVEVLSVVASQILCIQQAKKAKKSKFDFEGTLDLQLKQSCNVFITMNPGYAGRSDLPDNLKVLFRPVAMMVPEYAMIAEISLYSYGFVQARELANKIVSTYNLCSEQLSNQLHYDYGMRAVKTVLTSVYQLKKQFQHTQEDQIVLRAIMESNMPKFLEQDIDLFKGIISDLFPGVQQMQSEQSELNEQIESALDKRLFMHMPQMKLKVQQLDETINVRHGLMIVGQSFCGKSSIYKILQQALNMEKANAFNTHVINPKALTIKEIYGYSDLISKEWTEGVLGEVFRRCSQSVQLDQRHCIIFDGAVSTDWIENMNTVLDDNRKLCLMNAESIPMTNMMTMVFEVDDLQHASPATVSRCGMVYVPPNTLPYQALLHTYFLQPLFTNINTKHPELLIHLQEVMDATLSKTLHFVRAKCKHYQPLTQNHIVSTLLTLLSSLLQEYSLLDIAFIRSRLSEKAEDMYPLYDIVFLEAVKWAVGASIQETQRNSFSQFFKKLTSDQLRAEAFNDKIIKFEKGIQIMHTNQNTCFDYMISKQFRWRLAKDIINEQLQGEEKKSNKIQDINDIVVETSESIQIKQLLALAIKNEYPLLLLGKSGTGKTLYVKQYLKSLSNQTFIKINLQFSAQTLAGQTQQQIDLRLVRRKKGVYGPKLGMKGILFVDDINLCKQDITGAQSSIELLRQVLDQKGWYNRSDSLKYQEIVDTNMIAAMGIPIGGRDFTSQRFVRHFQYININENNSQNLFTIFNSILELQLQENYNKQLQNIIEGIIFIYENVQTSLKPTPNKPHYMFNLRDIKRIIQGMLQYKIENDQEKEYYYQLIRLAVHEMSRCFYDRLIDLKDRKTYYTLVQNGIRQKMKEDFKQVVARSHESLSKLSVYEFQNKVEVLESVLFNDIHTDDLSQPYEEVSDREAMEKRVQALLDDHNTVSKKPMELVLFTYAVYNLLKLTRALKVEQGHVMLIGLGGSGRNSLSRFAVYMREYQLIELDIHQHYDRESWRNDLQSLMVKTGVEQSRACLLIQESQVKGQYEYILEDLNSLLNTGDVPNVFSQEEFIPFKETMVSNIKKDYPELEQVDQLTTVQVYDFFIKSLLKHLHVIITINPIATALRHKIRNYPSLVGCTNIIWYDRWPLEGLHAVAINKLANNKQETKDNEITVKLTKEFYQSAKQLAELYLNQEKRQVYMTPAIYLQLLSTFNKLIIEGKQKMHDDINRYKNGSLSLQKTTEMVRNMETELVQREPELIVYKEETTELAQQIKQQVEAMQPIKEKVEEEQEYVQEKFKSAQVMKDECQKDLMRAKPMQKKAEEALKLLQPSDLITIKGMFNPPQTVKLVFEAVCVLLEEQPTMVPKPSNPKEKEPKYWETTRQLLSKPKDFMHRLEDYNKDNIPEHVIEKIRKNYIANTKDFNIKKVEQAANNAMGIFEWILAMSEYDKVIKFVKPKLQKLDEANQQVKTLEHNLKEKMDELGILNAKIDELQEKYDAAMSKQQELENSINFCRLKIKRANQIVDGLGDEKTRWLEVQEVLKHSQQLLFGDILLSTAFIVFLGPFTKAYRQIAMQEWTEQMKKQNVKFSDNLKLQKVVGSAVEILQWNMYQLPKDQYSIENGLIYQQNKRYPLFIDPQMQANRWIKNQELNNQLKVAKQSDNDFLRKLETAVQLGQPFLIESLGQEILSVLDPLLSQQFYKNAGVMMVKIGENALEYSKDFRLFLTTKINNPHYSPETYAKVNIINFMLTEEALQDQLLEIAMEIDETACNDENIRLIQEDYQNSKQLMLIENKILVILQNSDNILDNEEACTVLQNSKKLTHEIYEKQQQAKTTLQKIQDKKVCYQPIANHGATLFQVLQKIQNLDVMYQYSLEWFNRFYVQCFHLAKQSNYHQERIDMLHKTISQQFFTQICQGLYQDHKRVFIFVLLIELMKAHNEVQSDEYNFFLAGDVTGNKSHRDPQQVIPLGKLMDEQMMDQLTGLQSLVPRFRDIIIHMNGDRNSWKLFMTCNNPLKESFPTEYTDLSPLQILCLLRVLRPDKITQAVMHLISTSPHLGPAYIDFPPFNLQKSYNDSNSQLPLLFLLPGNDPVEMLTKLAKQQSKQLKIISLGQGQGTIAENTIQQARKNGEWVLLQNCHLFPSWLNRLEDIIEQVSSKSSHPSFRLFLTSFTTSLIPIPILQSSLKITNESPQGINYNLQSSLKIDLLQDPTFFKHSNKLELRNYVLALILLHSVILERKTFNSLGWNNQYGFNQSDLSISLQQTSLILGKQNADESFLTAIKYLVGECNYGGRVTDLQDRRMLTALLDDFFHMDILQNNYQFKGIEHKLFASNQTNKNSLQDLEYYVKKVDNNPDPQLFGLHSNSEFTRSIGQGAQLQQHVLDCLQLTTSSNEDNSQTNGDNNDLLKETVDNIREQVPKKFDVRIAQAKYPYDYHNSMNTLLIQELSRFNKLTSNMHQSMSDIEGALEGSIPLTEQIEKVCDSLKQGRVPQQWLKYSYPSEKPLGLYISDLAKRIKYFQEWLDNKEPVVHWLAGYYFTQSFLTSILQNHARKYNYAIDTIDFHSHFLDILETYDISQSKLDSKQSRPVEGEGNLIYGMFMEGGAWDPAKGIIRESTFKVLLTHAPVIYLQPQRRDQIRLQEGIQHYQCPLYNTLSRAGTLSTTGHSNNFIMMIKMPTEQEPNHWVKRSLALFLQKTHS